MTDEQYQDKFNNLPNKPLLDLDALKQHLSIEIGVCKEYDYYQSEPSILISAKLLWDGEVINESKAHAY